MNRIIFLLVIPVFFTCKAKQNQITENKYPKLKNEVVVDSIPLLDDKVIEYYASLITKKNLKKHLVKLTSVEYEGRRTGEKGQKLAAKYLVDYYKSKDIAPAYEKTGKYLQKIPKEFMKGRSKNDSENVLAFIYGTEKREEIIVISAHYDHLGVNNKGDYFFGADDNGSGTAALLEIAESFQKAVVEGEGPKRSILFLNFTGEEEGLFGSKYYASHPAFPLKNTVVNLNIDMVGRVDNRHKNGDYVYLIGADKISKELHYLSEAVNDKYTKLELDYKYNDDKDPNRFYYRSDHYNFAKSGIPIIFYFNGTHKDYHKPTDTEDKINYDALQKRAQLVFYTAWQIANKVERLKVD
jgi:Zn-dependent M28 family amino/carboxypeptidase